MSDPYDRRLTYLRVYSGRFAPGATCSTPPQDRKEVARLFRMHANKRERLDGASAGDIVAAVGPQGAATGDTLTDPAHPLLLEPMRFPEPVIALAIEPSTKRTPRSSPPPSARLADEDPTLRVRTDADTGQNMIAGMGELHLEIIVDRLMREFGVDANVGQPQVAYRETVRRRVEKIEGRFVRQTGGRGQFGHVYLSLEPNEAGAGFEFESKIVGGSIPKEYIPAVDQGIQEALEGGVVAGFPIVDVKVQLVDGSYHEVDSSEIAFKIAGSMAVKEAAKRASPCLLEPVMAVEVVVPKEFVGTVVGDLTSRRGRIGGMEPRGATAEVVNAQVPLSQMFGYATSVRSATQGRATFTMQFHSYPGGPELHRRGDPSEGRRRLRLTVVTAGPPGPAVIGR